MSQIYLFFPETIHGWSGINFFFLTAVITAYGVMLMSLIISQWDRIHLALEIHEKWTVIAHKKLLIQIYWLTNKVWMTFHDLASRLSLVVTDPITHLLMWKLERQREILNFLWLKWKARQDQVCVFNSLPQKYCYYLFHH